MQLGAFLALIAALSVLPPGVSGRKHQGMPGQAAPTAAHPGPLTLGTVQCLAHCFTQVRAPGF